MGKKIIVPLFLLLGLITVLLVAQLNAILGDISRSLARAPLGNAKPAYRVALIYQNNNAAFWRQIRAGATAAAKGQPVYVNVMEEQHGQELQLVDYLRLATMARYDGLIVSGDDERIAPLIQAAWDAGIPTLMIAADLPDSARLGYVGANNYRVGYVAGKTLLRQLGPAAEPQLAILSPLTGDNPQFSVAEAQKVFGFREAVSSRKPVVPIWEKSDPTLVDSLLIVRGLLRNHPGLNGIYATYPEGTLAAARVIQEQNAGARLRLIGQGDSPAIRADIQAGALGASIVEYPYQMGYAAVREMLRYFREGRINIANNIEVKVLDRANLRAAARRGRP